MPADSITRTADLSDCGRYRYSLTRRWADGLAMVFVMLNPSLADASIDDPTIRRCVGFARREGYAAIEVVNVFALRSPDPDLLYFPLVSPVGPGNRDAVNAAITRGGKVVAAWGAHPLARRHYAAMFRPTTTLWCLGTTKDGSPRHPLYVRGDQPLIPWSGYAR